MRYNKKDWNKIMKAPSYIDDLEDVEYPKPDMVLNKHGWEIYMEGDRVLWNFNPLYMGEFKYTPKSFQNEGSDYPEEWDEWLVSAFISKMKGYRYIRPKYTGLLRWID